MNVILLMVDSLNRRYLSPYGAKDSHTPNFDRLAKKCVTMDQHWTGSLPTMPARHEVMSGRYDYMWRGWGPLEPFDVTLGQLCKPKGTVSMLLTDTYHYFQEGSGNFHTDFDGWELLRGHEADTWKTEPVEPLGVYKRMVKEKGERSMRYVRNTNKFRDERDFFGPRLMQNAAEWIDNNFMHDSFFFMIDSFDCHEPFHVPAPYDKMFDPDFAGETVIWPLYGDASAYPEEEVKNMKAQYQGKIAMFDKWLGVLLDRMDRYNLWDNTMFVLTTDHGVHLGEHGQLGKNQAPYYTILTQIPMFMWHPQMKLESGSRCKALTSTIDIFPTIVEALNLELPKDYVYHGYSMMPLLNGEKEKIRDLAHTGYYGAGTVITDGKWALHKFPNATNQPLYSYGLRMERFHQRNIVEPYQKGEVGRFLPWTDAQVFRLKMAAPPAQGKSTTEIKEVIPTMLFDLDKGDTDPSLNVIDQHPEIAERLRKGLAEEFRRVQAPEEQYVRLELLD